MCWTFADADYRHPGPTWTTAWTRKRPMYRPLPRRWGWSAMHWSATPWVAASPFVPPANSRRAWHAW
ncbi:hypothetical protein G6F52_014145 [Rhizopus delemar]|nr:hypothetical protein G6F52_014145 [Rhizopus delemar]